MNPDFRDLLHVSCEAEDRFLVVGAYALAVHGRPRATGDLDIWVEPTVENAARVYRALVAFGAPLEDLTRGDLATAGVVLQMGLPPGRIDILTSISGVEFSGAWSRRTTARFGDVETPVIGREDLLVNKRASGRPKDLVDADLLERESEPDD